MPCAPINTTLPPFVPIPNPLGIPFAPTGLSLTLPPGFPSDILDLIKNLNLPLLPVIGILDSNYVHDILDIVMKLIDFLWPWLGLYKIILVIMQLILCIIEVICSLTNPFAMISAIENLFFNCIPAFLSLFPIFALIVLILSIIFLIILLIEYLIAKIIQLILILLRNIAALALAFSLSDEVGIVAILAKLGAVICEFQQLLAILIIIDAIITIIRAMLTLPFSIPPCSDSSTCCQPQLCPGWVKNNTNITASTGVLLYTSEVDFNGSASLSPPLPGFNLIQVERAETWQFYDPFATIFTQMQNINVAYDLPDGYSPTVLFPTSQTFTSTTPPAQAPYTVDLTLLYNPTQWGRTDPNGIRNIQITGCIVLTAPDGYYLDYQNNQQTETTGVAFLQGGSAYEIDGKTPIMIDGYQGTLNTMIHLAPTVSTSAPTLTPTGTFTFNPISYSFNINHPILLTNALITLGCVPSVATAKTFVNTTYANTSNVPALQALTLPDAGSAYNCLTAAVSTLQSNVTSEGVANFQSTTTACLNTLQDQATTAATSLISIGFDPYTSTFNLTPDVQFSSLTINVQAILMDTNGQLLTNGMPATLGPTIAQNITATPTFGTISPFVYDGYQYFNAQISSSSAGSGTIEVAYDGQIISTVNVATSTITPTSTPYSFVYAPLGVKTGVGDTDGAPRLGPSDVGG